MKKNRGMTGLCTIARHVFEFINLRGNALTGQESVEVRIYTCRSWQREMFCVLGKEKYL